MSNKQQNNQPEATENKTMEIQKKPQRLPANPSKAMQHMMNTIDNLKTRMIEETAALKQADTTLFMELQDKKLIVAREYLHGMEELMSRSDEIKNADSVLKDKFKETRKKFAVVAQENLDALEKMRNGMKKLEERIILSARKEADKENKFAYGSNGHLQNGIASRIGVNESV